MKRWKFFAIIILIAIAVGAAVFYFMYSRGISKMESTNPQPIIEQDNP
jgi:hypothetical protein